MWAKEAGVQQLLDEGGSFERIEAYIEGCRDISQDDRDALWLYAWIKHTELVSRPLTRGSSG
jgi:hypothetical protein